MKAGLLPELGQMADKLKLVPTRCNAPELYALRHALFRAVGSFKRVCHCSAVHGPVGAACAAFVNPGLDDTALSANARRPRPIPRGTPSHKSIFHVRLWRE